MPRKRNPTAADLEREQRVYGNVSPDRLKQEQKLSYHLAYAFEKGILRMQDIIEGREKPNDSAAVSAFRAVADVYQAKKKMEEAASRVDGKLATGGQASNAEREALGDLLKSFSVKEIDAARAGAGSDQAKVDLKLAKL